jgi:enterochelin esterase-like enzyme
VVVTLATFVAVVAFWPSLAGRHAGRVLGRVGLLLGVNFLVLLTSASFLNAQFLFFADWTDLKGAFTGPPTSTVVTRGGEAARAAQRRVNGHAAEGTVGSPKLPTGTLVSPGVVSYKVRGSAAGVLGTVVVALPPGYSDPANASRHYPVIEAFQGYPGSARTWYKTMDIDGAIAQRVSAKRMSPALVVMPQVEIPVGVDTECVDGSPGRRKVETWVAVDVPNWIAKNFRVRDARQSWATIGLSSGAWCAAEVTMLHPAQYSAAIVMGGYFRPEFGPFYQPYPPGGALAKRYNLVALAKKAPPAVAIWLETSHSDRVSYPSSVDFLKAARAPTAVDATVLEHAGHRISLWKGLLPKALDWLGTNIPGFRPGG